MNSHLDPVFKKIRSETNSLALSYQFYTRLDAVLRISVLLRSEMPCSRNYIEILRINYSVLFC